MQAKVCKNYTIFDSYEKASIKEAVSIILIKVTFLYTNITADINKMSILEKN